MQEVTVSTPQGKGEAIAQLAIECGIKGVTVARVRAYEAGKFSEQEEVTVSTSAPLSTCFVEAVMAAPAYDPAQYTIICDEVMAIVTDEPAREVSRPMKVASVYVLQELWQENHITSAYIARAGVSTLLLAYGLLSGDIGTLIIAFLITPFLSQVLAIGFGSWAGDWALARQGAAVLGLSTVIAIAAGALAAAVMGGPIQFDEYGTLTSNFAISLLVGILAGLDTADEAGRREFVAVAGAAQFASFPVWFGLSLVLGFPDPATTLWRIATFFVNIFAMLAVSLVVYAALRYRRHSVGRYTAIDTD